MEVPELANRKVDGENRVIQPYSPARGVEHVAFQVIDRASELASARPCQRLDRFVAFEGHVDPLVRADVEAVGSQQPRPLFLGQRGRRDRPVFREQA
jgi:hypothetical protein